MRRVNLPPVPMIDVRDVTAVCKTTLNRALATTGQSLTDEQYEDALGHLLAESISMADLEYDATKGISFSNYLTRYLPGRYVDWQRREFGDARNQTKRGEHVPLDDDNIDAIAEGDDFVDQIIEAASFRQDAAALSTEGAWIFENIARPIARGDSHEVVADALGISRRKVARLLEELRNELLGHALGLTCPTTDEIVETLHALDESPIDHARREQT